MTAPSSGTTTWSPTGERRARSCAPGTSGGGEAVLPTRLIFRCEFCAAAPDPETQATLEHQLRELTFGTYLEVPPNGWLAWHGGGPLGPRRYACRAHRGDLTAYLREHYGTIAPHPWKMPPYPATACSADTERAIRQGGLSAMPKWGVW